MTTSANRSTFHIWIKTLTGKVFKVNVTNSYTIQDIKWQIQKHPNCKGLHPSKQQLVFNHIHLPSRPYSKCISDYKIYANCTIILCCKLSTAPSIKKCSGSDVKENEIDSLSSIQISYNEFLDICDDTMIYDLSKQKKQKRKSILNQTPIEILSIIYSFARVVGGKKPKIKDEIKKWNDVHAAAYQGDINKCDELLQNGYYIDQWTDTKYGTPATALTISVLRGYVDLTEFLLINGARRRIRFLMEELEKQTSECSQYLGNEKRLIMLELLRPYAHL